MNIAEYERVKNYAYLEYCDYLQNKYGLGRAPFMTRSWNKSKGSSRTDEGLIAHHKYEDHAVMLSTKRFAMNNPYEWQMPENLARSVT